MRVQRSVQILAGLTTLATLAACSSPGGRRNEPDPNYSTTATVQWDSGPLDQAYRSERTDMDARHTQEIANPRAGESSDQTKQRHATESQDLESRYAQGKAAHAKSLPPSNRQGNDKGQSDKPHQ
jgi:hypothetical protein